MMVFSQVSGYIDIHCCEVKYPRWTIYRWEYPKSHPKPNQDKFIIKVHKNVYAEIEECDCAELVLDEKLLTGLYRIGGQNSIAEYLKEHFDMEERR